jgi:alginate O-acetyltransferase complex protein AlgI
VVFNSWEFALFFPVVYLLYLLLPTRRLQNLLLLGASYYFYAAWDWRFLGLVLGSTLLDYICARAIEEATDDRRRRMFLVASVIGNLTVLGFFKYYGFFVESLDDLLRPLGLTSRGVRLDIVLPIGVSFYTFQEMSYTIDVYRREIRATRSLLDFAVFVAFFPHMVAGPIQRAANLLYQVARPRRLTRAAFVSGGWLILWGLWKKIVIADNLARIVDPIFAGSATVAALPAYLGAVAFAFQIYCDFSAYSDIARGVARLLGFELMLNFNLPYFATNPSDFWRRWHISLSNWLRDYLYIPLGGSRGGEARTYRNLGLTMLLGGLWHGAAWNYIWWGAYQGALLIGHRLLGGERPPAKPGMGGAGWWLSVIVTFHFTLLGWLIFRSTRRVWVDGVSRDDSWRQMLEMVSALRNGLGLDVGSLELLVHVAVLCLPLLIVQWIQYRLQDHLVVLRLPMLGRAAAISLLVLTWLIWGIQDGESFIYFQF